MTARTPRTKRALVIALVLALVGGVGIATAVSATTASWTDRTLTSGTVTSGTWGKTTTASTCTALNNGGKVVGTCAVKSVTYTEWGSAGNHTRNMYLAFTVSDRSAHSIRFDVDLSTATGTPSGAGVWDWKTAATLNSGQIFPTSTCASLPRLQGTTASGWDLSSSPAFYFQATDNRAGTSSSSISCK